MKKFLDISADLSFYLLLGFLFLINFSIFICHLIFFLLLINFAIYLLRTGKWPSMPSYYRFFLLYALATLVSTVFSINKLNSLKDNKELFIFLLIPVISIILNSQKRVVYSLLTILSSAVIASIIGVYISIKNGISLDLRLKGLTSHWMTYSGLLTIVFVFFLVYLFYEKNKKIRIIIIISLLFIGSSIILSLTRSAWLALVSAACLFFLYYRPKIIYIAIPSLMVLILFLPDSVKSRFFSIFDPTNDTNKDRIYMAKTGMKIFLDYPITGVGANNIKQVYQKYRHKNSYPDNTHLHNNFIQILAERGALGLVTVFISFLLVFLNLKKRLAAIEGFYRHIAIGVMFAFTAFLVQGLFEYNFGDSEIKFILFFFLGIGFIKVPDEDNTPDRSVIL